MNKKGITLIEMLIVIAIIGIISAISIPAYIGQQTRAARTEASTNLENLRLLEEQFFADNSDYAPTTGNCAADNDANIALIQAQLPGFLPGNNLSYSYCIEINTALNGAGQTPCFRARAFGNATTRVADDEFRIDCNNNRDF